MTYRTARSPVGGCPRCHEALQTVKEPDTSPLYRQWIVGFCPKCGGVFADNAASKSITTSLDRALLEIGFQAALGRPRAEDDGTTLTCPVCQVEMTKRRLTSAMCEIDVCAAHGTWFDTQEMVDVIKAFDRSRRQGAVAERGGTPNYYDMRKFELPEGLVPGPLAVLLSFLG